MLLTSIGLKSCKYKQTVMTIPAMFYEKKSTHIDIQEYFTRNRLNYPVEIKMDTVLEDVDHVPEEGARESDSSSLKKNLVWLINVVVLPKMFFVAKRIQRQVEA